MESFRGVEGFYSYDKYELDIEQANMLEHSVRRIFNFTQSSGPKRSQSPEQKAKKYTGSAFRRILPEEVEEPLMARRIRVFVPGYNHITHQGFKSGDHCIGVAMLYRASRPHFFYEINYLRAKRKPMTYYYELIPHRSELLVTEQCAGTEQLFTEPAESHHIDSDILSLRHWTEEVYSSSVGKNRFKEGMRGGMSFAHPIFKSNVPVVPPKSYEEDWPWEHYLKPARG